MSRFNLFLLAFSVIATVSALTYFLANRSVSYYRPGVSAQADQAAELARQAFSRKKAAGVDLRSGPCLSEDLLPGWVADVVHNPRVRSDDLPINQCLIYLTGKASHFVEVDMDGRVVRVQ